MVKYIQMKNIAVVCGGNSGEYEVSLNSGRMVFESIDRTKFVPYYVVVKSSEWTVEAYGHIFPISKDDFSFTYNSEKIRFDLVYNVIHGTPGEDGKIQGYLELLGIPFVGPSVTCCVLTMNKAIAKQLVAFQGVPTAKCKVLLRTEKPDWESLAADLGLPLFMKPNNGGSSVATHKVYEVGNLQAAFDDGAQHDHEILAEEFIKGQEITCGIFDDGDELICLPTTEVRTHNDFFDYRAKYLGESEEITPAPVSEKLTQELNELTKNVYRILHCKGMVRVDFIVRDGKPYFMEVNTVPGFSKASIVPQQLRAAGLNIPDVLTKLIERELP